jgi:hypothetical protein
MRLGSKKVLLRLDLLELRLRLILSPKEFELKLSVINVRLDFKWRSFFEYGHMYILPCVRAQSSVLTPLNLFFDVYPSGN